MNHVIRVHTGTLSQIASDTQFRETVRRLLDQWFEGEDLTMISMSETNGSLIFVLQLIEQERD